MSFSSYILPSSFQIGKKKKKKGSLFWWEIKVQRRLSGFSQCHEINKWQSWKKLTSYSWEGSCAKLFYIDGLCLSQLDFYLTIQRCNNFYCKRKKNTPRLINNGGPTRDMHKCVSCSYVYTSLIVSLLILLFDSMGLSGNHPFERTEEDKISNNFVNLFWLLKEKIYWYQILLHS